MTTTQLLMIAALGFLVIARKELIRDVGFPCTRCWRGWARSYDITRGMKISFDFEANPNALEDFRNNHATQFWCGRCDATWTYSKAAGWTELMPDDQPRTP